ncbi:hypothetical protein G6F57_022999 [Rhizopus arrhizus]|nr:hypothetical protein G6F57_022999 [Rhizopus arrhizus]
MAQFGIQRGGGLVEQHQLGLDGQRPGNGHALLLAARQVGGPGVGLFGHAALRQQFLGARAGAFQGPLLHGQQTFHHVADHRLVRKQLKVLEHHAGLLAHALHLFARQLPSGLEFNGFRPDG